MLGKQNQWIYFWSKMQSVRIQIRAKFCQSIFVYCSPNWIQYMIQYGEAVWVLRGTYALTLGSIRAHPAKNGQCVLESRVKRRETEPQQLLVAGIWARRNGWCVNLLIFGIFLAVSVPVPVLIGTQCNSCSPQPHDRVFSVLANGGRHPLYIYRKFWILPVLYRDSKQIISFACGN